MKDALRCGDESVDGDAPIGHPLLFAQFLHLYIQPHQVAPLTGDDEQIPGAGRLQDGLVANVGKVGHSKHVHDAPRLVRRIAYQMPANAAPHGTARSVTTHHVACAHRLHLTGMLGVGALKPHGNRVVSCLIVNFQIHESARVMRFQPSGCIAHRLQIEIMDTGLIQDYMGKFGQSIFRILHATMAHDVFRLPLVRLPESDFIDPASLLHHPFAKIECFEHFHRATGDTVSLTQLQRTVFLLDDAGADVGKCSQLRGQGQPSGAATNDQYIDLRWNRCVRGGIGKNFCDMWIARPEAVQMKLHRLEPDRNK